MVFFTNSKVEPIYRDGLEFDLTGWMRVRKNWGICSSWLTRYFVLDNGKLLGFTSKHSKSPDQIITLSDYCDIITKLDGHHHLCFALIPLNDNPVIYLQVDNISRFCMWVDTLSPLLTKSILRTSSKLNHSHSIHSIITWYQNHYTLLPEASLPNEKARRFSFNFIKIRFSREV